MAACRVVASVDVFDCISGEWASLPPMIASRSKHASAAISSQLFVSGGLGTNYRWDKTVFSGWCVLSGCRVRETDWVYCPLQS